MDGSLNAEQIEAAVFWKWMITAISLRLLSR
jgi:hypothetical protein